MRRISLGTALVLSLALAACGGSSKAADAPEAASGAPEAAAAAEAEPGGGGGAVEPTRKDDAPAAAEEQTPATLSSEELSTVLHAVLADPELGEHLHTDRPGRRPVKISGADLPKDLKVEAAGYPVSVVDGPKNEKDPVIVITRITVESGSVTVAYQYDAEKIRGTTRIKRTGGGWELASSRIVDR